MVRAVVLTWGPLPGSLVVGRIHFFAWLSPFLALRPSSPVPIRDSCLLPALWGRRSCDYFRINMCYTEHKEELLPGEGWQTREHICWLREWWALEEGGPGWKRLVGPQLTWAWAKYSDFLYPKNLQRPPLTVFAQGCLRFTGWTPTHGREWQWVGLHGGWAYSSSLTSFQSRHPKSLPSSASGPLSDGSRFVGNIDFMFTCEGTEYEITK